MKYVLTHELLVAMLRRAWDRGDAHAGRDDGFVRRRQADIDETIALYCGGTIEQPSPVALILKGALYAVRRDDGDILDVYMNDESVVGELANFDGDDVRISIERITTTNVEKAQDV